MEAFIGTLILMGIVKLKMELDCGKLVGMLSTDTSKAFDSLYSPLLIKKIRIISLLG